MQIRENEKASCLRESGGADTAERGIREIRNSQVARCGARSAGYLMEAVIISGGTIDGARLLSSRLSRNR